jgi:DUF4097 and DUF4098 domain-containing protein YvlB
MMDDSTGKRIQHTIKTIKMKLMKKTLLMAVLSMAATMGFTQDWKKEPFMVKSLSGQNIQHVHAETSGGNLTVQSGSDARVEVYVQPNNYKSVTGMSRSEIQARLDEYYDLDLSVSGQTLNAVAKPKKNMSNWNKSVSVSFVVYVSSNVSTHLRTSGGNIGLFGLTGKQDFTTSGGNLNLERLKGTIKGRTSGGNINLKEVSDNIDLTTSGGNITAENCNGNIELTTSGGSVSLTGLNGDIEATTSGGNVKGTGIRGSLGAHTSGGNVRMEDLRCAIEASTSGGNIDVEITELTGAVRLTNSSGSIDLSIPNKGMDLDLRASKIKTGNLSNFSGNVEEDEVRGKVNGGGPSVTARASSGRISLSLK